MKKWLIIGAIVLLLVGIGVPWLLLANGWEDNARDIAIILLVLFHLVSVTLMIVLLSSIVVMVPVVMDLSASIVDVMAGSDQAGVRPSRSSRRRR